MTTRLYTDDLFLAHDPGEGHPERVERLQAIRSALAKLPADVAWAPSRDATEEEITRVHERPHYNLLASLSGRHAILDPDTTMSPRSFDAAVRAAGAAVTLVDDLLEKRADNGFALVRPPGHHAERERAMGFCLFNNIAVGAAHAVAKGLERVAVVDWDVHHGNGTQHAFQSRRDVLFVSSHRFPFYPGTGDASETGTGEGKGYTVNVPLPPSMGDGDYGALFQDLVAPVLQAYRPQLVLVSAGFDPHARDPLGGMDVTEEGFGGMCTVLRDVARELQAPLGLVLEGGYDLTGLAQSVRRCVEVLAGESATVRTSTTQAGGRALVAAAEAQRGLWAF